MRKRSIGSVIVGVGLFAGVLTACGDDSSSAGSDSTSSATRTSERSASVSRPPTVPSSPATVPAPVDEVEGPQAPGNPVTDGNRPPVPAATHTSTPPGDDGPHDLLGNIAIWTTADGNPLDGTAFVVDSCGDGTDVGPVDMSGQAYIDVPVSIGCWVVGLTRTPEGYALGDGQSQKTVYLDERTNEVILNFRFVATGQAAPVDPSS